MSGPGGWTDCNLGCRRIIGRRREDFPLPAHPLDHVVGTFNRGVSVIGQQDQGVIGQKRLNAASRLDHLRHAVVSPLDRPDRSERSVLVGVVVVVREGQQHEVEAVPGDKFRPAAGRVHVPLAGDRTGFAAGFHRRIEVAVEQFLRAPGSVIELQQPRLDRLAGDADQVDVMPVATPVDQKRSRSCAQSLVVQRLKHGFDRGAQVAEVHVVDQVVKRTEEPERPCGLER